MRKIFGLIVALIFTSNLNATHYMGGSISYKYLGTVGNNYKYQLITTIFYDCGDALNPNPAPPDPQITINADGPNGGNINSILLQVNCFNANDVCPSSPTTCSTIGAVFKGIKQCTFIGEILLPSNNLGIWTFKFETGNRGNTATLANGTTLGFALKTTLNTAVKFNDNSVVFNSTIGAPYFCVNQFACIDLKIDDIDGGDLHSTNSSQVFCNAGGGCTYQAPFTSVSPISGTYNLINDTVFILPNTIGAFNMGFEVKQFTSSGLYIGSVFREMQFLTAGCGTGSPTLSCNNYGMIDTTKLVGGKIISRDSIEVCAEINFKCQIKFTDYTRMFIDGINITPFTNIIPTLTEDSIIVNGQKIYNLYVDLSWSTPPAFPFNYKGIATKININIKNKNCPIPSRISRNFILLRKPKTFILPDTNQLTKCGNDTIHLTANGYKNFIWRDLSGGQAQSINCDTCKSVIVFPYISATYVVEGFPQTNKICIYKDTIKVKVAPDFILTASSNDNKVCFGTPVQLLADISLPPVGFTYLWTRIDDNGNTVLPLYLNSATDKNPTTLTAPTSAAIPPGVYTYKVDAISPDGCKRTETITITITQEKPPVFTLSQTQKLFCNYNGSATINAAAIFAPPPSPASCQNSNGEPCYGDPSPFLGTSNGISSNNVATQPGLLAGAQKTMRQQYLFTMAELAVKGIPNKGKISALSFFVTNLIPDLNKDYKSYSNVTIKIGCTNLNSLSGLALNGPFSGAPTTVVYNKPLRIKQGMNEIKFANVNSLIAYEYDGTGATPNFIIEITSTSAAAPIVNATPQVELMTSFFTSSVFNSGNVLPTTILNSNSAKPNFKFRYCSNSATDNTVNTFNWTSNLSSAIFSNATVANPTINFTQSGTYTLNCEVTTASKACKEDKTIQVFVRPKPIFDFTALSSYLKICSNNNSFNILNYVFPKTNVEFSGSPAISNSIFGTFNPNLAINGTNTIIMTVQDSAQFAVAPNGPCVSTENISIRVDAFKPATITNKGILGTNYCIDNKAKYQLNVVPPQLGVFSGALDLSGSFIPANLGVGTQRLYYTTLAPCGDKDSLDITIHKQPNVSIDLNGTNLCIPVSLKLNANTDPMQGFYKWNYNGGQTSTIQNPTIDYTSVITDKIELQFTDNFGCTNLSTKSITTLEKPKALFKPSTNNTTTFSPVISFENTSIDVVGKSSEYKWNIGSLLEAYSRNTVFNFENNPGNYTVSLIVKSSNGCEDMYSDNVNITVTYALFVPTAFNPNSSSSENKKLLIKSIGLQKDYIRFQVYDRLGAKVFESSDYNTFWNGKVNNSGSYCQPGIYVWKASIKDITNKSYELNGNTVLLK